MIRNLVIVAVAFAALCAPAAAQQRPKLKAEVTVTSGVVRIGDLVENAGIIARVPIFRAPDLGVTGTVPAEAVVEAVSHHQLIGLDTGDIGEVTVTRASRTIPAKAIEERVAQALAAQYALGPAQDVTVTFDRELTAIQVEPAAKGDPRVALLNYDSRTGRFDVTLDMPTGATSRGALRLSGHAAATAEVVTLTHSVDRGEVIKTSDVAIERRPRADIGRDILRTTEQVVGLAARAALRPGQPLRGAELMKPELVQQNQMVTLIYQMPGMRLTSRGKAVEGGAEGDTIGVLNEQSKRTVQGVVVGAGRVLVSPVAPQLAANLPVGR
ncbi:MAG TPA: flagellar basal body P-ring formation chaperone FlgA [Pseudolabrys sp.]|nr:flagellar basal body P-ring formation chaperone FlgA [Pseudolabrys sp.]